MAYARLSLSLFMLALLPWKTVSQSWQSLNGPVVPHEVVDIAVGKNLSGQKIFAADTDTLKVSTDAGTSWIATGASSFLSPLAVACARTNPSKAFAAKSGTTDAIWRTTDGGANWQAWTSTPSYQINPQRLAVSPLSSDLVFLGTARTPGDNQTTLWRTTNGGNNWYAVTFPAAFVNDILIDPSDDNNILVATSSQDVIYEPDIYEEQEQTHRGLWYSTDRGETWNPRGNIGSTDQQFTAIAWSDYQNVIGLFLASRQSGQQGSIIFQSSDDGVSWVNSVTLPTGMSQVRSIEVNPYHQNMILVGTNNGMYMTTDQGVSWDDDGTNIPSAALNIYRIAFDLTDQNGYTAYIATGSSVYKGTYSSGSWSWSADITGSNPLNTTAITVRGDNVFAVSETWTGISKFSGGTWSLVSSKKGFSGTTATTNRSNGSKVAVGGQLGDNGVVYWTSDGGSTWTEGFQSGINTVVTHVLADQKSNSNWVWAALGGTGTLSNNYRYSTNSGANWTADNTYNSGNPVNRFGINTSSGTSYSKEIYAGVGGYGVEKSTDAVPIGRRRDRI